jgi:hypothetical protein
MPSQEQSYDFPKIEYRGCFYRFGTLAEVRSLEARIEERDPATGRPLARHSRGITSGVPMTPGALAAAIPAYITALKDICWPAYMLAVAIYCRQQRTHRRKDSELIATSLAIRDITS